MKKSETIDLIAKALVNVQQSMKPAIKSSTNPHFKSRYSDIYSVWEAIREPLTSNGITVWQDVTTGDKTVSVSTHVIHVSGQWIEFGPLTIPLIKYDAQGIGSAISYAKRYALSAALGVVSCDEDDDGNDSIKYVPAPKETEAENKTYTKKQEYLSEEQIQIINNMIGDNGNLLDWFVNKLSNLKIENSKTIPSNWFNDVCESINKKKKELNIQS